MSSVRVLINGAAGRVGTILRSHRGGRYDLRLADVRPIDDLSSHEHAVTFDMTRRDDCVEVCRDIDIVVHLAADSGSEDFDDSLLPRNVVGPLYLLEGAVAAGCRRVILTSSIYAVRGHGPDPPIEPDGPVYPQGLYGASKCWGEALARVFASQHQLSTVVIRLGNPGFDQEGAWDPEEPSYMISPRDTADLFGRCVELEEVDFAIVHGSSQHRRLWLGLDATRRLLGFDPKDGTAFPRANEPSE